MNYPKKPRAKKKPIGDEERINIALDRFGRQGKLFSVKALAEKYKRDPGVISRAVAEAFSKQLVELRTANESQPHAVSDPVRCEELERQLQEKFDLLGAIVVKIPSNEEERAWSAPHRRDWLHEMLGRAMAHAIAKGPLFWPGTSIGLGSGRGVFYTIEALAALAPLRAADVTLVSLTGDVYARDHARQMNLRMDADTHVNLLSRCFAKSVIPHLLSARIVYEDVKLTDQARTKSWVGEYWQKPTHALVGLGVLKEGHSFFDSVRSEQSAAKDVLWPIKQDLTQLVELSESFSSRYPNYCAIADISNRLFVVPPPIASSEIRSEESDITLASQPAIPKRSRPTQLHFR